MLKKIKPSVAGIKMRSKAVIAGVTSSVLLVTMLDSWAVGSLGILMSLAGVIYAGFSLFRQQWGGIAVGLGVAAIMGFGPAIVTSMFTGVI